LERTKGKRAVKQKEKELKNWKDEKKELERRKYGRR
jgi:hypothetical protein